MNSYVKIVKGHVEEDLIFVERKGIGHPDTLADNLAESLSRAYSQYTLNNFGIVLHHNFDKLGILGGKSEVSFGRGRLISPIRVLVNGRLSTSFAGNKIPYKDLINKQIVTFFREYFADLIPKNMINIEYNISTASSPGHSKSNESKGSSRKNWFTPQSIEDLPEYKRLFSNDTSIGSGYYPIHYFEKFVLDLEKALTHGEFSEKRPWVGSDVKIMGAKIEDQTTITLCVPQISKFVKNLESYKANIDDTLKFIKGFAAKNLAGSDLEIHINTRDDYDKEELYLTATGSSIESGDEGLVGRGNRVNGVISINHTMSMEGASGKNPVYHIGKLYYVAAHKIAKLVYDNFDCYNEVFLVSQSGRELCDPWKTVIKIDDTKINSINPEDVKKLVLKELKNIPNITEDLIYGRISIS